MGTDPFSLSSLIVFLASLLALLAAPLLGAVAVAVAAGIPSLPLPGAAGRPARSGPVATPSRRQV